MEQGGRGVGGGGTEWDAPVGFIIALCGVDRHAVFWCVAHVSSIRHVAHSDCGY